MKKLLSVLLALAMALQLMPLNIAMADTLKITAQPKSTVAPIGWRISFSIGAQGDGLTYLWYAKNVGESAFKASTVKNAAFSLTMTEACVDRQIYCVVTDQYGNSVQSNTVTLYKGTPLKITAQPKNTVAPIGMRISFSITAQGDGLTYLWYAKNVGESSFKASTVKNASFSMTMTEACVDRQIYCVVTDKYGNSVRSNTVTLAKGPDLKITEQPKDVVAPIGGKISFSVAAEGEGLKYLWYCKNAGETAFKPSAITQAVFSYYMIDAFVDRQVYCVVTDKYGNSVKSNTITLRKGGTPLKITEQPKDVVAPLGGKVSFSVAAQGDGLTYLWYAKNVGETSFKASGVKTASFTTTMTAALADRQVYCVITDKYGRSVQSNTITLRNGTPLKITTQPKDVMAPLGGKVSFSVTAQGDGLTYLWYAKNVGETAFKASSVKTASFTTSMTAALADRQVYCVVTDKYGRSVQSNTITLRKGTPLKITVQPKSSVTPIGGKVSFSVGAQGEGLTYMWYAKNVGETAFKASGVKTASLSTTMTAALADRQVYCVITDKYGNSVKSDTITLYKGTPLKITAQPVSTIAPLGGRVSFSVGAQGEGLTYLWYAKNVGETAFKASSVKTASFSTNMTAALVDRQIYCVITDKYGNSVQSDTVTLRKKTDLKIIVQPQDNSAMIGSKISFSLTAEGDGLTYLWYYKNVGDTAFRPSTIKTAGFTTTMSNVHVDQQIYCVVTDQYGNSVQSNTVTLRKGTPLQITTQPEDSIAPIGGKVSFSIAAQGDGLTYLWYAKNVGETEFKASTVKTAAFSLTMTEACAERQIYCVVTDKYGNSVVSDTVTLLLDLPVPEGLLYGIYGNTVTIMDYTGSETQLIIPAMIEGYPVTEIGPYAFRDCAALTSVTIPSTVTSIRGHAFYNCYTLTSVNIPNGVTSIGERAFYQCHNLLSIAIPDSVKSIGVSAFYKCKSLTSVSIPDGITSISYWWFYGCESLTSVTIPASVTSIGEYAFYACTNLKSISIPKGVTSIGSHAFAECESLTDVSIPDSVKFIGGDAFCGCESLSSVNIPDGLTYIKYQTFRDTSLTSVTIPNSVISIESYAFYCCYELTSIVVPSSVAFIDDYAFDFSWPTFYVTENSYAHQYCLENNRNYIIVK